MDHTSIFKYSLLLLIGFLFYGCEMPLALTIENPDRILVVDATITDELTTQTILLSRTYPFNNSIVEIEVPPETNAEVKIVDSANNEYFFEESEPGTYISRREFRAQPNKTYQLKIITNDGTIYESEPISLTFGTSIGELYGTRTVYNGKDGVALLLKSHSYNPKGSRYYKFEFRETFKIVSPYESYADYKLVDNSSLVLVRKTKEEHVCYRSQFSKEILLADTQRYKENKLNDYLIRFLETESAILSHRYTILLKQYAISQQTYNYYHTLKEFSESGGVFSQIQPGFIPGNIQATGNSNKKVIGIFSASSVSSKRIYIDHSDFYEPDEEKPFYAKNCKLLYPLPKPLIRMVRAGLVKFYRSENIVVHTPCMDCTVFGSNVKPDFWEKEL